MASLLCCAATRAGFNTCGDRRRAQCGPVRAVDVSQRITGLKSNVQTDVSTGRFRDRSLATSTGINSLGGETQDEAQRELRTARFASRMRDAQLHHFVSRLWPQKRGSVGRPDGRTTSAANRCCESSADRTSLSTSATFGSFQDGAVRRFPHISTLL